MSKQPFMPLFFGDFLASTAEWGGEERALYLLTLAHSWSAGSLPADSERLRRLLGYDKQTFKDAWPQVAEKFVERDGRLFNLRLEEHRAKTEDLASKRAAVGKKGAEKRWQSAGNSQANGMPLPSSTDSKCHLMSMPSIPSHPIPSEEGESLRSSLGDLSPSSLPERPEKKAKNGLSGPRDPEKARETPSQIANRRAEAAAALPDKVRQIAAAATPGAKS